MNPQILLEQATARLSEHLQNAVFRLEAEEAKSRTKVPRFLYSVIFQHLIGSVMLFAIDQVKFEWEEAKKLVSCEMLEMDLEACTCTIVLQFGLPCRHRLATICFPNHLDSMPIPIQLLHPHWKIEDEPLSNTSWIMPSSLSSDLLVDPALTTVQHD